MAPPEPRISNDRTVYYNMKTSRPPAVSGKSHSHHHSSHSSHSHTQSRSSNRGSSTPMASPRMPYSVGQAYPPKLSPSAVPRPQLTTPAHQINTQDVRTPSPSYFGLVVEPATEPRDSTAMPRNNWSPPSSSVKSFQAAIPQQLPLDANPEFEAFKRQADANRGRTFSLSGSHVGGGAGTPSSNGAPSLLRPRPPRWPTHGSDAGSEASFPKPSGPLTGKIRDPSTARMDIDTDSNSVNSQHDSAYVSADSKRNSEASLNPPSFINMPRYESPAQFESPFENRSGISKVDDRHPRLSLMQDKVNPPSPDPKQLHPARRADTVPSKFDSTGPGLIDPGRLKELIESSDSDALLLIDVRSSAQYAQSRIQEALNLCIPTTLLKRATYNLKKLQETFRNGEDQDRFARWQAAKNLVVYDAFSSEKRDAVICMNMIKKFTNEGFTGNCLILRGGFNGFVTTYPSLIDIQTMGDSGSPLLSLGSGAGADTRKPGVAPVIGGVMLPATSNNPNPFFANIRQNQDLRDGVGQMDIAIPAGLDADGLPKWLRDAAHTPDHGKQVSEKFLNIELAEQSRMQGAYSAFNAAAKTPGRNAADKVQLSGIEKGVKNRYKDILPFEHARVRLQGRAEGVCDYVNASHIKASRSNKRYIASQGPLPATFEDFWSVIWDQDVRVIVMLTAESEGGQLKCHPYWTGREFGPIKLRALSEKKVSLDIDKYRSNSSVTLPSETPGADSGTSSGSATAGVQHHNSFGFGAAMNSSEMGRRRANTTTTLEGSTPTPVQPSLPRDGTPSGNNNETPYVIIRKFALSHAAHPFAPIREITHLHYPSWPDFGAPAQPSHLLALVELANVMQRAALPIDVPGALASAHGSNDSITSPGQAASRSGRSSLGGVSPKQKADPISVAWYDEPEADAQARPMLVHCSAGCGRTGAFCTVDSVIDMLKRQRLRNVRKANRNIERRLGGGRSSAEERDADGDISMDDSVDEDFDDPISPGTSVTEPSPMFRLNNESRTGGNEQAEDLLSPTATAGLEDTIWMNDETVDLIAKTVEDFRGQRLSMVQSLRQFVLCYETIIEWIWRLQEKGGPRVGIGPGALRARGRSGTFTN